MNFIESKTAFAIREILFCCDYRLKKRQILIFMMISLGEITQSDFIMSILHSEFISFRTFQAKKVKPYRAFPEKIR